MTMLTYILGIIRLLIKAVRGIVCVVWKSLIHLAEVLMWEMVVIRTEVVTEESPDNEKESKRKSRKAFDLSEVALKMKSLHVVF